jgi:phytoene desaturase
MLYFLILIFYQHAKDIYDEPRQWWTFVLLTSISYGCKCSASKEWISFLLAPLAPDINDTEALREEYFEKIMNRFEAVTKQQKKILYLKSFCKNDFVSEYNSVVGNAYGMAN